ncbi:protein cholesin isoform 2-T2 [Dama dama]|uniref:uncharacterized protein C7orf50 homolog isoform X2 n=1 Tax=Dama dama TaxID=30532 RepID=UPI002A35EE57|nr:uncharacterized protein C7orf50 homolog isoform X2 [Dama dama]
MRGDLAVFLSAACRGRGDQGAGRAGGPRSPLVCLLRDGKTEEKREQSGREKEQKPEGVSCTDAPSTRSPAGRQDGPCQGVRIRIRVPGGAEGPGEEAEEGAEERGAEAAAGDGHRCGSKPGEQALGGRASPGIPVQEGPRPAVTALDRVEPRGQEATRRSSLPDPDPGRFSASWAQKHEDWRFQKTRQTWLLLHMYDRDQVPDEHFPTLLAYLEGLRGRARELTVQKAEALMRELDQVGACALPPGGTQRARQVLQLLS